MKKIGVRISAARTLGKIGDARAVEPLIQALKEDSDWSVRHEAVEALGEIGDAREIEPLAATLDYLNRWFQKGGLVYSSDYRSHKDFANIIKKALQKLSQKVE